MRKPNFRYNSPYPQTRTARVVVPGGLIIPEELRLPPYLPDIVEPHEYRDDYVESYRRRERDHHRIKLTPGGSRFAIRRVVIPVLERPFEDFYLTGREDGYRVDWTDHYQPTRKLNVYMHRRQKDWKHPTRSDPDHSRAPAWRLIPRPYLQMLYGAGATANPGIFADSALALWNAGVR
jgi:hypothetical protein